MTKDSYGYIINADDNYKEIAFILKEKKSIILPWTDEKMTAYDIILNINLHKVGMLGLQSGLDTSYMFVTIMRRGAFAFKEPTVSPHYVAEKLDIGYDITATKLAQFINGVLKELQK